MTLQPTVSLLHIIEGVAQPGDSVAGLYARPAPADCARGREKDVLLVHVALAGPLEQNRDLLNHLTHLCADSFFAAGGSVTAALREAANRTNQRLLQLNQAQPDGRRFGALAVAALRDDELLMVQIGEAFALIGRNFGLEALPQSAPAEWVPLGAQADPQLRYYHNWVQAGDLLLLADPRIAHVPKELFVPTLVNRTQGHAAEDLQRLLVRNSARLILVGLAEERAATETKRFPAAPPRVDEARFASLPAAAPLPLRAADEEALRAEAIRQQRRQQLAPPVPVRATPQPAVSTAAPADPPTDAAPLPRRAPAALPAREPLRLRPQPPADAARDDTPDDDEAAVWPADAPNEAPAAEDEAQEDDPAPAGRSVERGARQAAAGALNALANALRGMAALLNNLRRPGARDSASPPREATYALIIALVIPILVTLAVTGVLAQRNEVSVLAALRQETVNAYEQAQALDRAGNRAGARLAYERVLSLAGEADGITTEDNTINDRRTAARAALDRIDGIVRLEARTLHRYDVGAQITRLLLASNDSYRAIVVVDSQNSIVWEHRADNNWSLLAEPPQRIVGRQDTIGVQTFGQPVDVAWVRTGDGARDAIVAVDRAGVLAFTYVNMRDRTSFQLGLASEWGEPVSLLTYGRNFYVLDRGRRQIWRYVPGGSGYTLEEAYRAIELGTLRAADPNDALIVPDDGSVMVAFDDGRVGRFRQGLAQWDQTRLDAQGLLGATAVTQAGSGNTASYYVLDAPGNRIVQFSSAGTAIAQYRVTLTSERLSADLAPGDVLMRANDLAVLENPLRIFLVVDDVLLAAELP